MTQQAASLSPQAILDQFKKNSVSHVVMLPDSETNFLYMLMDADPDISILHVAREGQSFSTAAGLAHGGKKPVVLIQNTGLLESCDSLRGWGMHLKTPLVVMVGFRGWTRHGVNSLTDVARFTKPILYALGLQFYLVESDADADRISLAFKDADDTKKPVVVLVGDEYHGFTNR